MILVSACLAGIACRYDGSSGADEVIAALVGEGKALPLCPEILGGLPIPRPPCEIVPQEKGRDKVMDRNGNDWTDAFEKGARITLEICRCAGIGEAVLKSDSPSCGCGTVYDGTFRGKIIDGRGLTADLLIGEGIAVYSEKGWREKK